MISLTDGMILYHGSYTEVSQIQLEKCSKGKDFGRGFLFDQFSQSGGKVYKAFM